MEVFVNGWYGPFFPILKALGFIVLMATVARGFVAFGTWRTSFRNRLLGAEPREEVS